MVRRIATLLLCLLSVTAILAAQENSNDVFLSLTRKAEQLKNLPTNVSVVTGEQIREKGARTLGEALKDEVGLSVAQYGTQGQMSNISIRGSTAEQTLVLIDGRRANDIATGNADLSTIPLDSIERVEIIRGAASGIYGANAYGGVINIITRKPSENTPMLSVGASGGSFNERDYTLHFAVKRDRTYGIVTAGKSSFDGWRTNSDNDSRDLFARVGYDARDLGRFDLSGSTLRKKLGTPGMAVVPGSYTPLTPDRYNGTAERATRSPLDRQDNARDYLRLDHTLPRGANTLSTSLYASNDLTSFNKPSSFIKSDYRSFVFGGGLQFATARGITVGGEWREEKHVQNDLMADTEKMDRSRVTGALYAQEEFAWDRLSVIPNLRFDDDSLFGSEISPKLTLVYRASDSFKFSANTGKAWRAPTFDDLFWPLENFSDSGVTYITQGNPSLKPEESVRYDLGVELQKETYRGSVTFFLNDNTDQIRWNGVFDAASMTSTYRPENIDKSVQEGAEIEFGQNLFSGLRHTVNYTYLWAENTTARKVLSYCPRNTANYALTYRTAWEMRVQANAQYVGPQMDTQYNTEFPAYTLVGLGVRQRIGDLELWAQADNLLNEKYQTRLGYPLPGLTLQTGLTVRFWE